MAHDAIARMGYAITKPEPVITKRHGPVETVMVTAADDLAATVKRLEEKMNSIAKDATSLAAPIKTLEERMNDIAKSVTYMQDRVSRIGERLSAVGGRVAKLEAATPAKVRVVLPEMPGRFVDQDLIAGWDACMAAVTRALAAAIENTHKEA
jgi:outer membrane murein-binding lipoprotein Lpp